MVASLLLEPDEKRQFAELLRPEPLPDGSEPEERMTVGGLSWQQYLALDKALGDDRPGPRLCYLEGQLEIMTTSIEHERLVEWLGAFIEIYFEHRDIRFTTRGSATMQQAMKQAAAQPDKAWCLGREKKFPDLVLEIALTSGGVEKLEVYRRFAVAEVWIWRRGKLVFYGLREDGSGYEPFSQSQLLPGFKRPLAERCIRMEDALEARRTFRLGLK